MINTWEERLRAAQDAGFDEGCLVGLVEGIIAIIDLLQDPSIPNKDKAKEKLSDPFYAEASEILKKYPNYSLEHQAKRVIYEATYLPPY